MKISTKALLLSALVCPGAGHYLLERKIEFIALLTSTIVCLYIMFTKLYSTAQEIALQIQSGDLAFDIQLISDKLHSDAFSGDISQINIAVVVLCITWVIGIIDSYRQGLKQDLASLQKS